MTWAEDSEFFSVGALFAPAGVPAAKSAVRARLALRYGDVRRYAQQALDADLYANEARRAGTIVQRSNVTGNAWSGWYEAITSLPSGW